MKKLYSTLLITLLTILLCSSLSFAATTTTTVMEVVDKPICEMNLDNIGKFEKKLTNFDASKKEVTLTLTVTNQKEVEAIKDVEIYLVLDNSGSMAKTYNGKPKTEYVTNAANAFTNSIFEHNSNAKIGVVTFSNSEAKDADNNYTELGTLKDANLKLGLTNSKENVKNTITEYQNSTAGGFTNIQAGLSIAKSNFSNSTTSKKYIILLSDGVPNLSLDTSHTLTYSGVNASNTKNELESINEKGYHMFSILMGVSDANTPNPNAPNSPNGDHKMTYRELAEEIFGTTSNPTVGDFFYIDYENLSSIINDKILSDITATADNTLKNIVIKDYFPKEIIDNFDFEYVKSPNIGKVSTKVDTIDNSITWTIDLLKESEVATLSYKLKLKDNFSKDILNKVLPTNAKVDINYEHGDKKLNINSTVSPTVRVKDNTTTGGKIPQTGNYNTTVFICAAIAIVCFAITRIIYLKKNNHKQ